MDWLPFTVFNPAGGNNDPNRGVAQVVSIWNFWVLEPSSNSMNWSKGLTTAVGMWGASTIGLMYSADMYITAIMAAFFAYLTLDFHRLFPWLFSVTKISHPTDESIGEEARGKHSDKAHFYDHDHNGCFT
ncbi:MgtC/SapB family protein [Brevibacillus gelatini]|uniref:MgtC/SapB family protein n=1 Tax=Brevibacillus gelatini TaxID=1655277 RepID=UPI001472A700